MPTKTIERYFFFALLIITFIFTFFIFRPFLIVLILGASFAVILHPIQKWFKKHGFSSSLSSLVTVLIFIILICGPIFGIGVLVFKQSQEVYQIVVDGQKITPFIAGINDSINKILPTGVYFDFNQEASNFVSLLTNNIAKIFSTTLSAIFSFILMLLSIFYLLKDGTEWKKSLISLSPMSDKDDQKIISRLKQTINGVMKGYLLIALLQGILMGIGLMIFGVPNPALWGVVAAIASLIPSIGTALVSVPAVIFLYVTGNIPGAVGLLIWAVALVGLIDNFLNPFIVSKKIKIPEFLILFSVLGGIVLLGPVGILIGPLTVSLLYTLVSMYRNEFRQSGVL